MAERIIATRRFTSADQHLFAAASGDVNPMHMDGVAARRTQATAPVVHGIHMLIWVLDELARSDIPLARLKAIRVEFLKFIYLERTIVVSLSGSSDSKASLQVSEDGLLLATITLRFGQREEATDDPVIAGSPAVLVGERAEEPSLDVMAGLGGWLAPLPGSAELPRTYPAACAVLGDARVVALAQTSTIVGMLCPGLHSIYSSIAVTLVEDRPGRAGIGYRTTESDTRYNILSMAVAGSGLEGEITAVARQAPVSPPSIETLRRRVAPGEFAGVSALVVGGSRGLGAVTAGVIAAGGGRVTVTYVQGRAEAERLCGQINDSFGPDTARAVRLDVLSNDEPFPRIDRDISQVYYFATPPIFRQTYALFSKALHDEFSAAYVHRFHDLCRHVAAGVDPPRLGVFYPSSVAVTERPRGMTEYAMAKAAGELLCEDINAYDERIRVLCLRIPRTATDQTATVASTPAEDPLDVMLPAVRRVTAELSVMDPK